MLPKIYIQLNLHDITCVEKIWLPFLLFSVQFKFRKINKIGVLAKWLYYHHKKSYRRQILSYLLPNHVSSVRIICLVVFNNHWQIDEPKLQVGTAIYMFDRYFLVVYSNFLYWSFPGDVCLNGFSHGLHNGLLSYLGLLDDPNHWWIHLTMNSDGC